MNIILAHGILGFSHLDVPLNPVDYFSGVAKFLTEQFDASVLAPAVSPTDGIAVRAEMLRQSISDALMNGELRSGDETHIIAHSMGGLDSRSLLTKSPSIQTSKGKVVIKTLVTIGTPHQGSPIADLIALKFLDKIPFLGPAVGQAGIALNQVLGHFRISLNGLHDLTSESAARFNSANPNQKSVQYRSYAGGGRPGAIPTSLFFLPYHEFITAHSLGEEISDGVVTVSSAKFGDFDSDLWPTDHADEIGHNLDVPLAGPDPLILQRYRKIVAQL